MKDKYVAPKRIQLKNHPQLTEKGLKNLFRPILPSLVSAMWYREVRNEYSRGHYQSEHRYVG